MKRGMLVRLKLITELRLYEPITLVESLARDARNAPTLKDINDLIDRWDPKEVIRMLRWQGADGASGQREELRTRENLKLLESKVSETSRDDIPRLKSRLKPPLLRL